MTQMNLDDIERSFWEKVEQERQFALSAARARYRAVFCAPFRYIVRVGDALSQFINVLVFFSHNPNESISGKAYRLRKESKSWNVGYHIVNAIFFLQEDHCRASYLKDVKRARRTLLNYRGK